jgi:hypothetical protein
VAYTKTVTLTEEEDMWLQQELQPYREDIFPVQEGNTASIAQGILDKIGSAPKANVT